MSGPASATGAVLDMPLARMSRKRLASMRAAGAEIQECYRVLRGGGLDIVGEVLRGQGAFVEYEHYPREDVYDATSHAQYYYHAHRSFPGEHGHFHTFLRAPGMPAGARPVRHGGAEPWPQGDQALAHLIGISMDAYGYPTGLFATNRWVTGEAWYPARDVIRMLDRFRIDHAFPSWPVNRWITAMFVLFRPHIEALLCQRDVVVRDWARSHPAVDTLEDRELEITGSVAISVEGALSDLDRLLGAGSPSAAFA